MSSILQLFLSLLKSPTMQRTGAEEHIFNPKLCQDTNLFLFLFKEWAKRASEVSNNKDAPNVLERFDVVSITHSKVEHSGEHEFLIIETSDGDHPDRETTSFILERTVTNEEQVTESEPKKRIGKGLGTLGSVLARTDSHIITSMEEGDAQPSGSNSESLSFSFDGLAISDITDRISILFPYTFDRLSVTDLVTLISTQAFHSLNKIPVYEAADRWLGENHVSSKKWHGECVGYFKPNNLSLFQLAILAQEAHTLHPHYTLLKRQCYFYANLIYSAAETHFGIRPSRNADAARDEYIYTIDSHLQDKDGRFGGFKVNIVNQNDIEELIRSYKAAHTKIMSEIMVKSNMKTAFQDIKDIVAKVAVNFSPSSCLFEAPNTHVCSLSKLSTSYFKVSAMPSPQPSWSESPFLNLVCT